MSAESIDYTAILADLEAKRAALDQTIASFRQALAMGALGQAGEAGAVPSLGVPSLTGGEVPTGAFLGLSIIDAAKMYLEIVKKKQTAKEIMDGLVKGGMESTSRSFLKTVHASLTRARQAKNPPFVKVGLQYGLTSWFPKGIASGGSPKKAVRRTAKKTANKSESTKKPQPIAAKKAADAARPQQHSSSGMSPNTQKVLGLISSKMGSRITLQEIAKETKLDVPTVNRLLSNLIRGRRVDKNVDGFRILTASTNNHAAA